MLTPEDRFFCWQSYEKRIRKLFDDVDDDLIYQFAPYGKNEDKDTPNVKIVREVLEKLLDFVRAHLAQLDDEYSVFDAERSNSQFRFNCWLYGLCPDVLQKLNLTFGLDIQAIAKFIQSQTISRDDTQQAVELWRQQNISRSA